MITLEQYLEEARRYAGHAFCYAEFVDDAERELKHAWVNGHDVYETLDHLGEVFGLDRADSSATWGINAYKTFERKL